MRVLILALSKLPFFVLHRVSDFAFVLIFYVVRYRRRVVRENLLHAFPEKSVEERAQIERQFFRNFCDLIIEVVKNFSLTSAELQARCRLMTPSIFEELWREKVNVTGISSHLANWEILALSLSANSKHLCYGVYKPLSDVKMDQFIIKSRQRFGIQMIPMKSVRQKMDHPDRSPVLLGLLSDQAPHDYSKAFQVKFLGVDTYVVPGPGVITVERGLIPIWGWMRRVGRSKFEWGVERLDHILASNRGAATYLASNWSSDDRQQIARIAQAHGLSEERAAQALALTKEFCARLEARIRENPADWLWSHRRWKKR